MRWAVAERSVLGDVVSSHQFVSCLPVATSLHVPVSLCSCNPFQSWRAIGNGRQ